jgi:hypothetical protein
MSSKPRPHIDFDEWADLAKRDPVAFERRRARVIEDFLQQVPHRRRQRLRCLQWRIDRTRELAANPVAACVRISRMMWDSLLGDHGLLDTLESGRRPCPRPASRCSARVLAFKRR